MWLNPLCKPHIATLYNIFWTCCEGGGKLHCKAANSLNMMPLCFHFWLLATNYHNQSFCKLANSVSIKAGHDEQLEAVQILVAGEVPEGNLEKMRLSWLMLLLVATLFSKATARHSKTSSKSGSTFLSRVLNSA